MEEPIRMIIMGHGCVYPHNKITVPANVTYVQTVECGIKSITSFHKSKIDETANLTSSIISGFFKKDWRTKSPELLLHYDSSDSSSPPKFNELISAHKEGEEIYNVFYSPLNYVKTDNLWIAVKSGIYLSSDIKPQEIKTEVAIKLLPGKTVENTYITHSDIVKIFKDSSHPTVENVIAALNKQLLINGERRLMLPTDSCTIKLLMDTIHSKFSFNLSDIIAVTDTYPLMYIYDPLCKTSCNNTAQIDFTEYNANLRKQNAKLETRLAESHLPSDLLEELEKGGRKRRRRSAKKRRVRNTRSKRITK